MEKYIVTIKNSDCFISDDENYVFNTKEEAEGFIKRLYVFNYLDDEPYINKDEEETYFNKKYHEGRITYISGEWADYSINKADDPTFIFNALNYDYVLDVLNTIPEG